jgi:hypothetical protein
MNVTQSAALISVALTSRGMGEAHSLVRDHREVTP